MGFGILGHIFHIIPLIAYLGFAVMILISLGGRPLWGLYYLIPFLPYRSLRNHLFQFPLGESALTLLVIAVVVGALLHGKRLPPSKLYLIWVIIGIYFYFSMWIGFSMGNAPAPIMLHEKNFATWKDYMLVPLVFVAACLVVEDRKAIRNVIILTALTLLVIDRSSILEALSHSWANFDESKRDNNGPLVYGVNVTAAYLVQFGMFFWGAVQFVKTRKYKLIGYGLIALTMYALMYTFSRGGYLAALVAILVLGILKDRKLLVVLALFLVTWQSVVPNAVKQRVTMTKNDNGQLEASSQERITLWKESWGKFLHSPIVGNGFATFWYGEHVSELRDTHNWFIKVMEETGLIGILLNTLLLQQMLAISWRAFRRSVDPLYKGLGLGLILAFFASMVANFFGDRWTYLEISGPMWVLLGLAVRAVQLTSQKPATELDSMGLPFGASPKRLEKVVFASRNAV